MSDVMVVTQPVEIAKFQALGADISTLAAALMVTDDASYVIAAEFLRDVVRPAKQEIADHHRPRIKQADALHKGLIADERKFLGPLEQGEQIVTARMVAFRQAQARLRAEAELTALRERTRLEAEEAARVAAKNLQLQREAETARIVEAAAAEARGDTATARRLIDAPVVAETVVARPVFVPRAPVAAPPPKVEGFRAPVAPWRADCYDLDATIAAAAAGNASARDVLQYNQVAANKLAELRKEKLESTLPGVRATNAPRTP